MILRPPYFEAVREKAANLWNLLERDPDLAGPWHQLFNQVQSPRHVLSELLQNADDAGAIEASVRIERGVFLFDHNGEDFTEKHFGSLCRFGYSDKRALHTIGFRGIGFKSTFSLGGCVELFTPTLAVRFSRERFTEPHWLDQQVPTDGRTLVRVAISDQHRQKEIERNLQEWLASPISLLFFRNLRRIKIAGGELNWRKLGSGPVQDSHWVALHEQHDDRFLLIRSLPEPFPDDALTEIRQERLLAFDEEVQFPPCRVEIVLGTKGRLYVVLPTGVTTDLPFACNAPFIQDPARIRIKDPETSPTNRWLLERIGRLAARAMSEWLGNSEQPLSDRACAYDLLPVAAEEGGSLEIACGNIVKEAFSTDVDGKPVLLTEDGALTLEKQSIIIPNRLFQVWEPRVAASMLDETGRPPLCQNVSTLNRKKLVAWGFAEEIDKQKFLTILQQQHLQKPESWTQLLTLWAFVAPELTGYRPWITPAMARLVPVQGKEVLYAANEVVRLGERRLLQSDADWDLLSEYLIVVNQNWPRFLAEQRRSSVETGLRNQEPVEAAYALLEAIGLDEPSNADEIVSQVATKFFSKPQVTLPQCVRLAQIAAKLNTKIGEAFRFATKDGRLRGINQRILFDETGTLEELIPEQLRKEQLLHPEYSKEFASCSKDDWLAWVKSGQSGLHAFLPLTQKTRNVFGNREIEKLARNRGVHGELSWPYRTNEFVLEDWDFEEVYWRQWNTLAVEDEFVWVGVVERLLAQPEAYWTRARRARLLQVATTRSRKPITEEAATPSWVLHLRQLPCLPDTRGFPRKPGDLLRRTPQTESFMDVEHFLHGNLDRESVRSLLDLLGVRTAPTGPDRLIDCLRALSKAEHSPVEEVEKWYRRLDHMIDTCSTENANKVRNAFRTEKLILAQDGTWQSVHAVFLVADDGDVPDAAVVRSSVAELSLWRKIGVADHPTVELAIRWLNQLPSAEPLSQDDLRRVRALLTRHPIRIWEECGHWLNLAGEWRATTDLYYALTMQSLITWAHLYAWVKQKTADLQRLPVEVIGNPPFSRLPPLSTRVENRLHQQPLFGGEPIGKEWLRVLGTELSRVELGNNEETERVRTLANALVGTRWYETPGLEIIPYIDGTPAGTPRDVDVVWLDCALYVAPISKAKLARRVPEELARHFLRPDIRAALDYSFERAPDDVREYLNENFTLSAVALSARAAPKQDSPADEPESIVGADVAKEEEPALGAKDTQPNAGEGIDEQIAASNDEEPGLGHSQETGIAVVRPRARPKPQPSLMDLFARDSGFHPDGPNRFANGDGSWIVRVPESSFPWERHDPSGTLLKSYLPLNCCFQEEPLELGADVWTLLNKRPESYSLVLRELDGSPMELSGSRLRALQDRGEITLHPAQYRVVFRAKERVVETRSEVPALG